MSEQDYYALLAEARSTERDGWRFDLPPHAVVTVVVNRAGNGADVDEGGFGP